MKTFMRLNLKKDKITDVQKALQAGSGEIEFKDFKQTLRE